MCWAETLTSDWHILAIWRDERIGTGLAWIRTDWHGLAFNWHRIGKDWHGLARIGTDWHGLTNW